VLANRFAELPPGCPFLVDPGAITKVAGSQSAASPQWEQLLSEAGYVVIAPGRPRLPDTPQLRRYITRNFQLVHNAAYLIYRNTNTAVSPQI
jgi:hypothetical protein